MTEEKPIHRAALLKSTIALSGQVVEVIKNETINLSRLFWSRHKYFYE